MSFIGIKFYFDSRNNVSKTDDRAYANTKYHTAGFNNYHKIVVHDHHDHIHVPKLWHT